MVWAILLVLALVAAPWLIRECRAIKREETDHEREVARRAALETAHELSRPLPSSWTRSCCDSMYGLSHEATCHWAPPPPSPAAESNRR